ncbi:MAG: DUF63 family protein [Candidatus Aenigmarchaeota archaeon]|nr:DUF63 family protein [Candidatus Aenigmarchaeota archaeon]
MSFIDDYFLNPMGHYYTLLGVLVYAIIFVIAIYLVYKYILKRFRIAIDYIFILSLVPFIIFGGMTRALRDAEVYKGFLFVSPGIYVTIFFITLISLAFSILLQRKFKIPYWKTMIAIGTALVLLDAGLVALVGIQNWSALYIYPAFFALWAIVFLALHKFYPQYMSNINALALFSQMMDASQSFIGVAFFGYYQQMPIVSVATSFTGAWIIFPIKLLLVFALLWTLDRYSDNIEMNNWIKLAIIILGMPMGARGMSRVAMSV